MSFGDSVPLNPLARTPAHPGSYQSEDDKTPAFIRRKSTAVTGVTTNLSDFDPEVEFPDLGKSTEMEHQDKAGPSNTGKDPQNQGPSRVLQKGNPKQRTKNYQLVETPEEEMNHPTMTTMMGTTHEGTLSVDP